jgi:hypothetical protein
MKATAAIFAFALAGCATVPPAGTGPTAALGQSIMLNGLRIRPIRIVEDSRCPAQVQCVWAGRIIVDTEISGAASYQRRNLELGKPSRLSTVPMRITLIAAEPGKVAGSETPADAYRLTYSVGMP